MLSSVLELPGSSRYHQPPKSGGLLVGSCLMDAIVDVCFPKKLFDGDIGAERVSVFLFKNLQKYGVILYCLLDIIM